MFLGIDEKYETLSIYAKLLVIIDMFCSLSKKLIFVNWQYYLSLDPSHLIIKNIFSVCLNRWLTVFLQENQVTIFPKIIKIREMAKVKLTKTATKMTRKKIMMSHQAMSRFQKSFKKSYNLDRKPHISNRSRLLLGPI